MGQVTLFRGADAVGDVALTLATISVAGALGRHPEGYKAHSDVPLGRDA